MSATHTPASDDQADDVARLVDEAAVRRVHMDYCRGIDRQDWELVRSCYHPDALDHHGPFTGSINGFIDWAIEFMDAIESITHFVGNQRVDIDGDTAWHEAYCRSYQRLKATPDDPVTDWTMNVRYLDRMERRDGAWRIADRLVVADTSTRTAVADGSLGPEWNRGSMGSDDPSYNRSLPWSEVLAPRR